MQILIGDNTYLVCKCLSKTTSKVIKSPLKVRDMIEASCHDYLQGFDVASEFVLLDSEYSEYSYSPLNIDVDEGLIQEHFPYDLGSTWFIDHDHSLMLGSTSDLVIGTTVYQYSKRFKSISTESRIIKLIPFGKKVTKDSSFVIRLIKCKFISTSELAFSRITIKFIFKNEVLVDVILDEETESKYVTRELKFEDVNLDDQNQRLSIDAQLAKVRLEAELEKDNNRGDVYVAYNRNGSDLDDR